MANTGYLIQPRLKRVTDDVNEFPLDENDNLCSETGLPQATIDNPTDSPTYRVLNSSTCPITADNYYLSLLDDGNGNLYADLRLLNGALENATIDIDFDWSVITNPLPTGSPFPINGSSTLLSGTNSVLVNTYNPTGEYLTDLQTSNANPNTMNGKNIITSV